MATSSNRPVGNLSVAARFSLTVLVLVLALATWAPGATAGATERQHASPARVEISDKQADLNRLYDLRVDIDAVLDGWAKVYVDDAGLNELRARGFTVTRLPDEGKIGLARLAEEGVALGVGRGMVPAQYHTYATLTADLQAIAADHPDIAVLTSAGQSVQGRELWIMKITDNPQVEEDEPGVAYISSMHGDEVVGKELTFNLINHLTDNYATDTRVAALVDNTEIWIMPSMNPDGTELGQRYNANGADLNRSFPDLFSDPNNTTAGRQPEVAAVMNWTAAHNVSLSANFHCGVLVANYPMDNNPTSSSVFSPAPAPDHDMMLSIARTYADNNPAMYASNSGGFDHGVTNGAAWYAIDGGMQDWNYGWYGNFQVTMEVSNSDWPPASQLPGIWDDNLESLLAYFERVHEGLRGLVTDAVSGAPVAATIYFDANPYPSYTDPEVGDYHRPMVPGSYSIQVVAEGYTTQVVPVSVLLGPATRLDVALQPSPTDLQPVDSRVEDGLDGDGYLQPGEVVDLALTLRNSGRLATGVTATLEPTGWYTPVSRAEAGYPDIPTLSEAESNAPHFEIAVDSDIPTGHKMGFAVHWKTADGSGVSEPIFLGLGGPACVTAQAGDLPLPIQDNQTTTSQIDFTQSVTIGELRVPVNITHTYIGDLELELFAPSGTSVLLHNNGGGGSSNIVGTYGVDLTPVESLDAFTGEPSTGVWRLEVRDTAGGDTGTLVAWSVEACDEPLEQATPRMRIRDVTLDHGKPVLHWWTYPGLTSYRVYRATDPSAAGSFFNVTGQDPDDTDTQFKDAFGTGDLVFYLVTGVGPQGEGPLGHFGQ